MSAGKATKPQREKSDEQMGKELLLISELELHVEWCIFHEGCDVFFVPPGSDELNDKMNSVADLRICYIQKEKGNQHAQEIITAANDALLLQVTQQAAAAVPGDYDLRDNFWWVAYHEGSMPAYRIWNANHEFSSIRADYLAKQLHNPNAAHLLSAVKNQYIINLVNSM
jgi:hypothetical protein